MAVVVAKRTSAALEKRQWQQQEQFLRNRAVRTERDAATDVRKLIDADQQIKASHDESESSRNSQKESIYSQITTLKVKVKDIQRLVEDCISHKTRPRSREQVEKLRKLVEAVEAEITSTRHTLSMRHSPEDSLTIDLDRSIAALQNWGELLPEDIAGMAINLQAPPVQPAPSHKAKKTEKKAVGVAALPEVESFEEFSKYTGGATGGWSDEEHILFLRCRERAQSDKRKLLELCLSDIPSKQVREVHAHERWYELYAKLLEAKKEAVIKWRQRENSEESV